MEALFVLLPLAVIGFAIWRWHQREQRRADLAAFAEQRGLRYSLRDPFRTLDLRLDLFEKGDGRGIENVIWGTFEGCELRLFDYWYFERQHHHDGPPTRRYFHYSCAIVPVDAATPHLRIAREGLLSSLADAVGFRDIEFESEEFNRAFEVRSSDRAFAYALVDARMMAWLLDSPAGVQFEVRGDVALVACGQLQPERFGVLGSLAAQFRAQIPAVVSSLYPPHRWRPAGSG